MPPAEMSSRLHSSLLSNSTPPDFLFYFQTYSSAPTDASDITYFISSDFRQLPMEPQKAFHNFFFFALCSSTSQHPKTDFDVSNRSSSLLIPLNYQKLYQRHDVSIFSGIYGTACAQSILKSNLQLAMKH